MSHAAVNAIATLIKADTTIMAGLTGGVWTRPIAQNVSTTSVETPGSTPDAFDTSNRIKPCLAIVGSQEPANRFGPTGAYISAPMLHFRCLPRETSKAALDTIIGKVIQLLRGKSVAVSSYGTAGVISIAGRDDFTDDPAIPNAVLSTVTLQLDGIWWTD